MERLFKCATMTTYMGFNFGNSNVIAFIVQIYLI